MQMNAYSLLLKEWEVTLSGHHRPCIRLQGLQSSSINPPPDFSSKLAMTASIAAGTDTHIPSLVLTAALLACEQMWCGIRKANIYSPGLFCPYLGEYIHGYQRATFVHDLAVLADPSPPPQYLSPIIEYLANGRRPFRLKCL